MGDCGLCAQHCFTSDLSNLLCDSQCDTEACWFDEGRCVTAARPVASYVDLGGRVGAVGTSSDPFRMIVDAFDGIWANFSVINIAPGSYSLAGGRRVDVPAGRTITLIGTQAELRLAIDSAWLEIAGTVIIQGVVVRGNFELVPGCSACTYCPFLAADRDKSHWFTDRGETADLSNVATQAMCDQFSEFSLFTVASGGRLQLVSVAFEGVRHQPNALVLSECGDIEMLNVTFRDCQGHYNGSYTGLVKQVQAFDQGPYFCGSLRYVSGLVEYLNNGYELSSSHQIGGVLAVVGMAFIRLDGVTFRRNNVMARNSSGSLVYFGNSREVVVTNCVFEGNIASWHAGVFLETELTLPVIVDRGVSVEHALVHFQIFNCSFVNNTSLLASATIAVLFHSEPQTVLISDCTLQNNFAGISGLIRVSADSLAAQYATGWVDDDTNASISPMYVHFLNLRVMSNYASIIVSLRNLPAVQITQCYLFDNGESLAGLTYQNYTVRLFVEDPVSYISQYDSPAVLTPCVQTVLIENAYNVTCTSSEVHACTCPKGSPGVTQSASTAFLQVRDLSFRDNTGRGLLSLAPSRDLVLTNLTFRNNTGTFSTKSVCLELLPETVVGLTLLNSYFEGNVGEAATLAVFTSVTPVYLASLLVFGNIGHSQSCCFIFNPPESLVSLLSLSDSKFANNTSFSKGAITVAHLESAGDLSTAVSSIRITNCTFEENHSNEGSVLMVDMTVSLSEDSLIENCTFLGNTAIEGGGCIYLEFNLGALTVNNSVFIGNSADDGAAIYSRHHNFNTQVRKPRLILSHLYFSKQTGQNSILLDGAGFFPLTFLAYNKFEGNEGSCVDASESIVEDVSSVYLGNRYRIGAVGHIHTKTELHAYSLLAENNIATTYGGAFYISENAVVSCLQCLFANNTSALVGGAVYFDQNATFNVTKSRFVRNRAASKGSAIFMLFSYLFVSNTSFLSNHAADHGTIAMTSSSASIANSTLAENTHSGRGAGIVLTLSSLVVTGSRFANQQAEEGTFVFALDSSLMNVEDSEFDTGRSGHSGGAIYMILGVSLELVNVRFHNCESSIGSAVFALRQCTITISRCSFDSLTSLYSEGALFGNDANITILDSHFSNVTGGAVYGELLTNVTIQGADFRYMSAERGAAVCCWSCESISISRSRFEGLQAGYGGAVFMDEQGDVTNSQSLTILESWFEGNSAGVGGCVSINSVTSLISNCDFIGNSAVYSKDIAGSGTGGVVMSTGKGQTYFLSNITRNRFAGNSADMKCGAVCWTHSMPSFSENQYLNNTARYAPDIGSFPIRLQPVSEDGRVLPYLNESAPPLAVSISNFCSGKVFDGHIFLALFDHQSNIYTIDSVSIAEFYASDNSSGKAYGSVRFVPKNGVLSITGMTLAGPPGSEQLFMVTAMGIDDSEAGTIKTVTIRVSFRDCLPGESLQDGVCHECTPGTFSFSPSQPCSVCPSEAVCNGGLEIGPRPGYWRADHMTDIFFRCPNTDACMGAETLSGFSQYGWCAVGYNGNLCNVCEGGYSKTSKYQCEKCPKMATNVSLSLLLALFALCVLAISIAIAVRGAARTRSELPILMKIIMNYVQVLMISAGLNLHWPDYVKKFLVAQEIMGNMAEQVFSLDCFYQDVPSIQSFYMKVAVMMAIPAVLFVLCLLTWWVLFHLRTISLFKEKVQASLVMVLFLLHPAIASSALSLFSCIQLKPEELWLEANMSVHCWDVSHVKFVLIIALPGIIVWVIGLPMVCFVQIMRNRRYLGDEKMRMKYSFLYKGYGGAQCYWEFVILYRKVLLVSSIVFLATVSTTVQALSVLAVGLVALFLQVYTSPFLEPQHNRLEIKALVVSCVTIFSGLYYQTQDLTNGYFLFDWARVVLPILINSIREKFKSQKKPYRVHNESGFRPKETPEEVGDVTADLSRSRGAIVPSPSIEPTPPMNTSMIHPEQFTFPRESPTPDRSLE